MQAPVPPVLVAWRCRCCSRILAKLVLAPGSIIEIRCKSCGTFSLLEKVEQRISTYH